MICFPSLIHEGAIKLYGRPLKLAPMKNRIGITPLEK